MTSNGNLSIEDLTESSVSSATEIMQKFEFGESERTFAETKMNTKSSRSHCIFKIQLNLENVYTDEIFSSTINQIDLAGSEGVAKSDIEGKRLKEGSSINKSLLAMYNVITKLNSGQSFVTFRESKLTRILQPYLGGNSLTSIICTVSPANTNLQETLNTLRFAMCAGGIKNEVKKNVTLRDRTVELKGQETSLAQERQKNIDYRENIEQQKSKIEELDEKLVAIKEDIIGMTKINEELERDELELDMEIEKYKIKIEEFQAETLAMKASIKELKESLDVINDDFTGGQKSMKSDIEKELRVIEMKNVRLIERNKILKKNIDVVNSELKKKEVSVENLGQMNSVLKESTEWLTKSITKTSHKRTNIVKYKRKKEIEVWLEKLNKEKEIQDLMIILEKLNKEIYIKDEALNNIKLKIYDSNYMVETTKEKQGHCYEMSTEAVSVPQLLPNGHDSLEINFSKTGRSESESNIGVSYRSEGKNFSFNKNRSYWGTLLWGYSYS